jgi:hypothetical protein
MEIVKEKQTKAKETQDIEKGPIPQYDPRKKYTWKPTDNFVIPGNEFGEILNSLRALLSSPTGQMVLLANRASEVIESTFADAVNKGIVVEVPEDKK